MNWMEWIEGVRLIKLIKLIELMKWMERKLWVYGMTRTKEINRINGNYELKIKDGMKKN